MVGLWVVAALAAPVAVHVPVQGAIVGADGSAVSGVRTVEFDLFSSETGGSSLHHESQSVSFSDGAFATLLGLETELTDDTLAANPVFWLQVTLTGDAAPARARVEAPPYARRAGRAADADKLGGEAPSAFVKWADDLGWADLDQASFPAWVQSGYSAGSGIVLSGSAFSLNQAVFPPWVFGGYSRGTGLLLTGATFSIDPSWVPASAGSAYDSPAEVVAALAGQDLAVRSLTSTQAVRADTVRVEGAASASTCTESGAIRWDTVANALRVCDGSQWRYVGASALGTSQGNAGRTCKDLKTRGVTTSGLYWIDPNLGGLSDAYQVYCDMDTDGGGWTVCLRFDFNTNVGTRRFDGSAFTTPFGGAAAPPTAYSTDCTQALTDLGNGTTFDFLARTHVAEPDQWQWVGPLTVSDWRAVYDSTTCAEVGTTSASTNFSQCRGSSTGGVVDVAAQGYRMGYHTASGGACTQGTSVNQFAQSTNVNVLMELNYGYNYGHALYLHFDCQAAAAHPCNPNGSGVNNSGGTGAGRLLVGQAGAAGPDCGPYDKDLGINRPTVSFGFRER